MPQPIYNVTGTHKATEVGNYQCTLSLADKVNYEWSDGTTDDIVHEWEIKTEPHYSENFFLPNMLVTSVNDAGHIFTRLNDGWISITPRNSVATLCSKWEFDDSRNGYIMHYNRYTISYRNYPKGKYILGSEYANPQSGSNYTGKISVFDIAEAVFGSQVEFELNVDTELAYVFISYGGRGETQAAVIRPYLYRLIE